MNIKNSANLGNGWSVSMVEDKPYDDLIMVVSPWGDRISLVKNEQEGGQSLLWRYFATVLHTKPQLLPPVSIPGYPWKYATRDIDGVGQVILTSTQEVP